MPDKFEYKYTALNEKEKKVVEDIRNQYLEQKMHISNIDKLKKLDSKVKNVPTAVALSIGIVSTLIFGVGLTFFLEWTDYMYVGIPFAVIGMLMTLMAYPIYNKVHIYMKNKYKDEIIRLSNDLLNEEEKNN